MSIHKRIKERRTQLEMSMQELAEAVGYSSWQTVQQWEKEGGTAPKRSKLPLVADALKCSVEYLTSGSEAKPESGEALQNLSGLEGHLVMLYRMLPLEKREALIMCAQDLATDAEPHRGVHNPYPTPKRRATDKAQ